VMWPSERDLVFRLEFRDPEEPLSAFAALGRKKRRVPDALAAIPSCSVCP
jgi:hypothetical protein